MARSFTTTELMFDLIKDPESLGRLVAKAVDLGLVVTGAGHDGAHDGYYRVSFHTGKERFAEPVADHMQDLAEFAKNL